MKKARSACPWQRGEAPPLCKAVGPCLGQESGYPVPSSGTSGVALGLSFPICETGTFLKTKKGCRSDWGVTKNHSWGEVPALPLPPRASPRGSAPAAELRARDPTHPCCSLAVVFSVWALRCGRTRHPVSPASCLCGPHPLTKVTHLLGWEVPASPGKPPPPTLPGHLLLLQLVHGALRADKGHGIFPCTTKTYLSLPPQTQSLGLTLERGAVRRLEAEEAHPAPSWGSTQRLMELSTGDQGPFPSIPTLPQPDPQL